MGTEETQLSGGIKSKGRKNLQSNFYYAHDRVRRTLFKNSSCAPNVYPLVMQNNDGIPFALSTKLGRVLTGASFRERCVPTDIILHYWAHEKYVSNILGKVNENLFHLYS